MAFSAPPWFMGVIFILVLIYDWDCEPPPRFMGMHLKKGTIAFLIKYYLTIGRLVFTLICLIYQILYVYLPIYFTLWVVTFNRSQSHKYISKISPWFICAIFRAGVTCPSPILVQNLMIYLYANHERFFINICRIKPLLYCYYYL